jgi:hypothetical protein
VEYLHLEFDNISTGFNTTITAGRKTSPIATSISSDSGVDIVRVGLNYLFR